MDNQGYPPVPPAGPAPGPQAPQVPPVPPIAGYGQAPPQVAYAQPPAAYPPPKRSRAWMWWTFGMLALITLIIVSCSVPFMLAEKGGRGLEGGDAIALIRLDGVIAGTGDTYSGYVTPEYFLDQLDQAVEDDTVKAIVLRVDSPGGTVAASEEIAAYVRDCDKPVVVSIGDIGASGAYMVSSQADEVIANAGSSVGSIGVISEIPNVGKLLGKVGVDFQVITAGKNKDTGSPYRPLTKEERALIQGEVNEAYEQFIAIVAKGRDMTPDQVRKLATGWAWSGEKALKLGLIDKVGTYDDALEAAAKRGKIEGDYDVVTYDDEFDQVLGSLLGIRKSLAQLADPTAVKEDAARRAVPR